MPAVISGPRCNRRVTCDHSPKNARNESDLAVNPLNPYNMVGASKRFTDPTNYVFSNAAYATFDGGQSWLEAPPLALPASPNGTPAAGSTDPALAWDNKGNTYLVALPFAQGTAADAIGPVLGVVVYQSADGGRTWGAPRLFSDGVADKPWAIGDVDSDSPFYGNVYVAWNSGNKLAFARTTDNGASWKGISVAGVDQLPGTPLPGINDAFSPALAVSSYGELYIVYHAAVQGGPASMKFVKSRDGGTSFSAPQVVAGPITETPGGVLPGGTFRVVTIPTACVGTGDNLVVAWGDYREGVSRVYYRHSPNRGVTWDGDPSGQPLLTGVVSSQSDRHDFHPQLANTPNGEIGCVFYEFWVTPIGEFSAQQQIDVVLAVSTNDSATFPNRVTVTDHPWDPTLDPVRLHQKPQYTFIGDYFGLAASQLGFFPFWTDTRTGVQEIFTSRLSVYPTDMFIRDSGADIGDVPSPGNHWESVDLIVRRQPDGDANFVNEDLLRDGVTDHYMYGRVTNNGQNTARHTRLAVTVGNYPSLLGLPGSEFRYPQDWYPGDWDTPTLQSRHLFLGESDPLDISSGSSQVILGPITWPAQNIPDSASWHPCLLAEVRSDNDDSAGGFNGCALPAQGNTNLCNYGSFFWGNNNICQRNLTYAPVMVTTATSIEFPFLVGSIWSEAQFLEIIIDKVEQLVDTIMKLRVEPVHPRPIIPTCCPVDLLLVDGGHVVVRVDNCGSVGEIIATPGTLWRTKCPPPGDTQPPEICLGGKKEGEEWKLTRPRAAVGFPITTGEVLRATLSFITPTSLKPNTHPLVRIFQRNDRQVITGGILLELVVK